MFSKHLEFTQEYITWMKHYGNGRNNKDLRFGQYICNMLNIHNSEVFNQENTANAYSLMIEA